MVHDRANWLIGMRRTALALTAAALSFACSDSPAVHAQSVMRSPNLNIQSRMPTINPTVAPRINSVTSIARTPPGRYSSYRGDVDAPECALLAEPFAGLQLRSS